MLDSSGQVTRQAVPSGAAMRPPCTVPGCERTNAARTYCDLHYRRVRKNGLVDRPRQVSWQERTRPGENGCVLWTGSVASNGYGRFNQYWVHRLFYATFVGPIPPRTDVDHICFTPLCVNPAHLQLLTPSVNRARQRRAMDGAICKRGHVMAEANIYRRPDIGSRQCRACARLRESRRSRRVAA